MLRRFGLFRADVSIPSLNATDDALIEDYVACDYVPYVRRKRQYDTQFDATQVEKAGRSTFRGG
jgi:hypothetical protein